MNDDDIRLVKAYAFWLAAMLLAVVVTALLADLARGAWGKAGCAAVAAPRYWWAPGDDPNQLHLLCDGTQVGTWRRDEQRYYPFDGSTWGAPAEPPVPPPAGDGTRTNYGIDEARWRSEPRRSVTGRGVPDDAGKVRLTVIGSEAERKQVIDDLTNNPILKSLADRVVVQDYAPTDWAVARVGFKTDGRPTIYLQAPNGKVLHRQDDYTGGAARLAEAIRKADPNYRPERDPDLTRSPSPADGSLWLQLLALVVAALLGNRASPVLRWLWERLRRRVGPPEWAEQLRREVEELKRRQGERGT